MVLGWVKSIESSQVAGIVDRDDETPSSDRIFSLRRRNLESYLWDPLFVLALLLDENHPSWKSFSTHLNCKSGKQILLSDKTVVQDALDKLLKIYSEIAAHTEPPNLVSVEYSGGNFFMLPDWIYEADFKKLTEPLRKRLDVRWDPKFLIRKYEVLDVVPEELSKTLKDIQYS